MKTKNPYRAIRTFSLVILLGTAKQAYPAGFQLGEQSATAIGRALAGYGMVGDDASAVFYNPAAMTLLEGRHAQGSVFYITSGSEFHNQGSTQQLSGGTLLTSGVEDDGGKDAIIPVTYFSTDLFERGRIGLAITTPFGLATDYDADWVGRYHALESELKTIDLNPSAALRLSDKLSIGAGISVQYAEATLSQAVFVFDPSTGAQLADGFARLKGNDWSLGYNLGVMYEWSPATRFGVGYRSRVAQTIKGKRRLQDIPDLSGTVQVEASLELPETIYVGAYHRFGNKWSMSAGARWTRWSRFEELRIQFADASPDDVTVFNWNDSWTLSIGIDYDYRPAWIFRMGYAYDESPVPNERRRTPRIPGNDRHWLSVGATYRYKDNLRLDLGYTHVFIKGAPINNTIDLAPSNVAPAGTFTDTLVGNYSSSSADSIGAQLHYGF